jgi:hypothetical protein
MKRTKTFLLLAAWLMALPLTMASCSDAEDTIEDAITPIKDEIDDIVDDIVPDPKPDPNDDDDNTDRPPLPDAPLPKSEYTIIFYGHGGGDLDRSILYNIEDLFNAEESSYDKVHATVMYKMSSQQALTEAVAAKYFNEDYNVKKFGHATFRFVVNQDYCLDTLMYKYFDDIAMSGRDIDIASPSTLTDYIKWAKEKAPAEKYILIIADHGCGYSPEEELPLDSYSLSKGVVYDDGANHDNLTAEKIVKAVNDADIHFEVIYLDACLMNTIEYQYELKDLANYLILSTFTVPGPGGDYMALIDELATNTNIETALAKVCDVTIEYWDEVADEETNEKFFPYSDISVIRTADIDPFGNLWKDFTDQLISAYQSNAKAKAAINKVTSKMMSITDGYAMYDMNYFAKQVIKSIPRYFDESLANDLDDAYNKYIVYRRASADLEKYGYKIGTSILFGCQNHYTAYLWDNDEDTGEPYLDSYITYEADGRMMYWELDGTQYDEDNWYGTLDNTYKRLKFDQLTHWSDWMAINEQEAGAYSPSAFEDEITDEGFVPKEY